MASSAGCKRSPPTASILPVCGLAAKIKPLWQGSRHVRNRGSASSLRRASRRASATAFENSESLVPGHGTGHKCVPLPRDRDLGQVPRASLSEAANANFDSEEGRIHTEFLERCRISCMRSPTPDVLPGVYLFQNSRADSGRLRTPLLSAPLGSAAPRGRFPAQAAPSKRHRCLARHYLQL